MISFVHLLPGTFLFKEVVRRLRQDHAWVRVVTLTDNVPIKIIKASHRVQRAASTPHFRAVSWFFPRFMLQQPRRC